MSDPERTAIERAIGRALLERWDPLGVHEQPGEHGEYTRYVAEIYSLLARGGSDTQVARRLHQIEREDFGMPESPTRDLSAVLVELRTIEHRI
ncbi:MAG TPA: hypothetical protein VIQ74_11680 [Gemmatimonadaceae bacterium]|jgi:hypothetical protein